MQPVDWLTSCPHRLWQRTTTLDGTAQKAKQGLLGVRTSSVKNERHHQERKEEGRCREKVTVKRATS